MTSFASPAILIRRVRYGESDLIVTLFTKNAGKIAAIAKAALKSVKRFPGTLEMFSELEVVCTKSRKGNLRLLQEAALVSPFSGIRQNVEKTAYASYWAEIVNGWMEDEQPQDEAYRLLQFGLEALDSGSKPNAELSILFQLRFMALIGLNPNFRTCSVCGKSIEGEGRQRVRFNLALGGVVCRECPSGMAGDGTRLSAGTLKQLTWVEEKELEKAARIHFNAQALEEGLNLLEVFVPYHLERVPKSLKILQQVRQR